MAVGWYHGGGGGGGGGRMRKLVIKKMIVEQEKRKKKEPHTWGSRRYVSNPIHPGVGLVLVVIRCCRHDFHTCSLIIKNH